MKTGGKHNPGQRHGLPEWRPEAAELPLLTPFGPKRNAGIRVCVCVCVCGFCLKSEKLCQGTQTHPHRRVYLPLRRSLCVFKKKKTNQGGLIQPCLV